MGFKSVSPRVDFPALEVEVLRYWQEDKIFEKSVKQRRGSKPFVFYEGPPTANGKPGIHHVMARSFKDLYPRYHTMRGEYCVRKGGWDCHGLPVELEIEKKNNISGKKQIEKFGIDEFNELCRKSVWEYVNDWTNLTKRIGYWIDLDNPYVTLENDYIETCWWLLGQMWDKKLLQKDFKVVPYCPRCGTPLSSHELSLGYQEVKDKSVYVKFKLVSEDAYLLAWTTTPWTLPGNVALAVDRNLDYVKVKHQGEILILAKSRVSEVLGNGYQILGQFKGSELEGKKYQQLFTSVKYDTPAHYVIAADFVSEEGGTGVVHTAVMYGVEDFELGSKVGLPKRHVVDSEGKFKDDVKEFAGKFVKDAESEIIKWLKDKGWLLKEEVVEHSYPFCWRCGTPLLYYAIESWFIRTTRHKDSIIAQNQLINWVPNYVKDGRMGDWLENMVDWSLSRSRYWGTPLPIWKCDSCESEVCVKSVQELRDLSVSKLKAELDLHRPTIDGVKLKCPDCSGQMTRYPYVLDCWFDSGAMPYAQYHYPFENQELFKQQFPADYICEAIDQTRGWFYTLLAISTLVSKEASYKNVLCLNLVLDEQGKKMSKSKGNVVDPWEVLNEFGADATRWYFYSYTPAGNVYRFAKKDVSDAARRFLLILWNVYNFFISYANLDQFGPSNEVTNNQLTVLDKWILARLNQTVAAVTLSLDRFDAYSASHRLEDFVSDLSLWYVRRSRDRVGPTADGGPDKLACHSTLYHLLTTISQLLAPFTPFMAEGMYRNLTGEESVHLASWPKAKKLSREEIKLIKDMQQVRKIVELGLAQRKAAGIKVRQPLRAMRVSTQHSALSAQLEQLIKDELNVKDVVWNKEDELSVTLDLNLDSTLIAEGEVRELARQIQEMRKEAGARLDQPIRLTVPRLPSDQTHLTWLKKQTLALEVKEGEKLWVELL